MHLGDLIATYGYAAVILGAMIEGETVVLLAGFAVHRGHLDFWLAAACAFAGSLLSDQIYFYIGRRHGAAWLARRPKWAQRITRIQAVAEAHQVKLTLAFRFIYGFRTITPLALGLGTMPAARFAALNMVSAAVWALCFTGLGFTLGQAIEPLISDIERYEGVLFIGLAAAGLLVWLVRRHRARTSPITL
jgi:membrane protein DedA with SNARE-associated domain